MNKTHTRASAWGREYDRRRKVEKLHGPLYEKDKFRECTPPEYIICDGFVNADCLTVAGCAGEQAARPF